jgi:predicted AAA+ superfamily ATPase
MKELFVFSASLWWPRLEALSTALENREPEAALRAYAGLYGTLIGRGAPDLPTAVAEDLLWEDSNLSLAVLRQREAPAGLRAGAVRDVETLREVLRRDWHAEVTGLTGESLPPLCQLATLHRHQDDHQAADTEALLSVLRQGAAGEVVAHLLEHYRQHGAGRLAKYAAFRWAEGVLQPILHPTCGGLEQLVGLSPQLSRLRHNTEAFLAGKPAPHTLLYGPRGSGKSTAVRGLLCYRNLGLRLIELAPASLGDLPKIIELLRGRPQRYILFVDDLSFEAGDARYQSLKTLLEGSLVLRPDNVLVYATSNRRHLLSERFADRPDPGSDDVHAWDTHNERLALADRFGLTLTFPGATQQRYLEIVHGLAAHEHIIQDHVAAEDIEIAALRFAAWGNGYSGRTARQFVDSLKVTQGNRKVS